MAANPPLPFSNDEKNFLLAEICKSASPPHTILLEVCNRLQIQPPWNEMPLPPGRSVNACRAAFDEMRRGPVSYSPLSATSGMPSAPIAIAPQPRAPESQYAAGRKILPRQAPYAFSPVATDQQPLKRKRGRPTKAEVQARAEAASSSSAVDPGTPQARLQTPMSVSVPPSPGIDVRSSTILPPVSRALPISAMITPAAPKSASHSGSSSGKRRRRRRSEEAAQDDPPVQQGQSYYSPTRQPGSLDSATRTSFMARRRDEAIHAGVARLGVSEPEQTAGALSSPAQQSGSTSHQPSPGRPPYQ